jgi:hypothetical protein
MPISIATSTLFLLPPSSLCSLRQFLRCGWRGDDRQNCIMIYGPKNDGTYIIDSRRPRARRWRSACRLERPAC